MATASIRFVGDSREARAAVDALERELEGLQAEFKQNTTASDGLARQSRTTTVSVESLERSINEIRNETLQYRTTLTQLNAELAQNRQALLSADAAGRESIETRNKQIQSEQRFLRVRQQTTAISLRNIQDQRRELLGISNSFQESARSGGIFQRSIDDITGALASFGIVEAGFAIAQFGRATVSAAAQLEGYSRGLQLIEGSRAPERLEELISVANLPGLQLDQLINFSNRLRAAGLEAEQVDKILLSTGQTIISFGGTSDVAAQAVEQITQAISTNTVSLQDFRSIAQRIPAFYNVIAETHGVEASIDGFRVAVERAGGSVADALIPVMDRLAERFGSPPADSYVVAVDALQNSFFLLQAEIGSQFLPTIARSANALSEFFDAIRENNLGELPEPIQAIVAGARELWEGLRAIGETIANAVGPEVRELVSALGSLLGEILGLAGSLLSSLAPAYEIITVGSRVLIALVTKLAQDVRTVIEAVSDFVDFISFWKEENDAAATSTKNLSEKVGEATAALSKNATETQRSAASATDLRTALLSVNTELERNRQRYQDLIAQGASPAAASMENLDRIITRLETDSAKLTGELDTLKNEFLSVETPIGNAVSATQEAIDSIDDFGGALSRVDTQFLTFHQRAEALSGAIRELPPEITAVSDAFRIVSPFAEQAAAQFDTLQNSLVDTEAEQKALKAATDDIIISTNALNAVTDAQIDRGNLIDPIIRQQTLSTREYAGEVSNLGVEYQDLDTLTENVINSSRGLIREISDVSDGFQAAEIEVVDFNDALDDLDAEIQADPVGGLATQLQGVIDNDPIAVLDTMVAGIANIDLETRDANESLLDMTSAFLSLAAGNPFPILEESAATLVTTLGAVFAGLARMEMFGGALGLPDDFFDDPVPGQARINPQNVVQGEQLAQQQVHQAGIARNLNVADPLSQIEILRENDPGIFQRFGTREFIEQNFPELVDVIYPSGQGFNQSGALARRADARSLSEATGTDRQATEDAALAMYGPEDYAAEVAAATGEALSDIPEPELSEIPEIADPLGTFSLTRDEREVLAPYETAVRIAEDAIEGLTADSTPQEIADAYQALVFAQTNLSSITEGIIRAAEDVGRITGTAATNAIRTLGLDLGDDLRTANNALISSLGDVGFEVVGGIENIREAIDVSDISSAFRRIPEQIEEETAAEPEPEADPQTLADVHRFSAAETTRLRILQAAVTAAEDAVGLLDESSTEAEITAAYGTLANAERDLYATKVGFIQSATDITEQARQDAFDLAEGLFGREIFDANQDLVNALKDIGLQLVATIDATTTILRGTALATQRIPEEVEDAADEPAADVDPDDPLPGLRSTARLAANQVRRSRTALGESTSEADFETRRLDLIQSINAAYTAQIALLDALGLSEADYQDRFEDAEDTRDAALTRATNSVNTFTEARIKGEEDVAEAAQDAADEQIAATERAAREQMQIDERAARDQLRIQERLESDIEDLRDEQTENEADRLESIADLHEDHNRRLLAIEEDFQDDLEDIRNRQFETGEDLQTERLRAIADLETRFARDVFGGDVVSFDELTAGQQEQVRQDTGFQRGLADIETGFGRDTQDFQRDFGLNAGNAAAIQDILDRLRSGDLTEAQAEPFIGRDRLDAFRDQQQSTEDLESRTAERETEINAQADATAAAIRESLQPLLTQSQTTAETEATTAQTAATTAETEATTAETQSTTAAMEAANAMANQTVAEMFNPAVNTFALAADTHQIAAEALLTAGTALSFNFENITSAIQRITGFEAETPEILEGQVVPEIQALPTGIAGALGQSDTFQNLVGEGLLGTGDNPLGLLANFGLVSASDTSRLRDLQAEGNVGAIELFLQDIDERIDREIEAGNERVIDYLDRLGNSNRLFHFEQTDRNLRNMAFTAAAAAPRRAPNALPTPDQRRNAHDIGREITAGVTEALDARGSRGGLREDIGGGLPEEMKADITLNFDDGSVTTFRDQVVRLRDQNRSL